MSKRKPRSELKRPPHGSCLSHADRLRWFGHDFDGSGCWIYRGARNRQTGYGVITHGGVTKGAHVVSWEFHHRQPVPKGFVVRHECDNPPCVNPAHLLTGTRADNSADMTARKRQARGTRVGGNRLTEEDVREIRALAAANESRYSIAESKGVAYATISDVLLGRSWAWLK